MLPMSHTPEEFDLSTVEDLNPEPSEVEGWFTHKREALLGLVIIAFVLGWAVWQWLDGEIKKSSYESAERSVTARDWDRARDDFRRASGFRDASTRAEDAEKHVEERDHHYAAAVQESSAQNWAGALQEIIEAQDIQPHFRDSDQIEEQARENAYTDALEGAVALRPHAQPPGLYYRGTKGWVWLEGSDEKSRVRNYGSDRQVIYDVPGSSPSSEEARRVLLASVPFAGSSGDPSFTELAFNMAAYDTFRWQPDGVWAFKYNLSSSGTRGPVIQSMGWYGAMVYQAHGEKAAVYVPVPGLNEDRVVLAIDPAHARLLMAAWTYEDGYGSNTLVQVYLTDLKGTTQKVIHTHRGKLVNAQFSPDGTYVLLQTVTFESDRNRILDIGNAAIIMLDLQGNEPPRVLVEQKGMPTSGSPYNRQEVGAAIISKGPYAGRVLLSSEDEGGHHPLLRIVDPANPADPLEEFPADLVGGAGSLEWTGIQSYEGLLLVGQTLAPQTQGVSENVTLVYFSGTGKPSVALLDIDSLRSMPGFATPMGMRGDNLLYGVNVFGQGTSRNEFYSLSKKSVKAVQGESEQGDLYRVTPRLFYSATLPEPSSSYLDTELNFPTFNFGPRALAYSDGKDRYVTSYDSTIADQETGSAQDIIGVKLESDVAQLFTSPYVDSDYFELR